MVIMRTLSLIAVALLMTSACTTPAAKTDEARVGSASLTEPAGQSSADRGLAFAQSHCAVCHAVTVGQSSPRAEAPAFESVVNTPGLTATTLQDWLRNSHNYPDAMTFRVEDDNIGDLAAYMLTLRKDSYHPPVI